MLDLNVKKKMCKTMQETEYASVEANKRAHRSASTRRSRAAEVHNLSERVSLERMHSSLYFDPLIFFT